MPEYLIEAWGLGMFMLSAGFFGTLLEYPGSPLHHAIPEPFLRRLLMGLAMGFTAIGLIYSPWGRQSGAHLNPAVTLTFVRLGRVRPWDGFFYMAAQFVGGALGVAAVLLCLGAAFQDAPVRCVATLPGPAGAGTAFVAEVAITFLMMSVVLWASNSARLHAWTGVFAGSLVAAYIAFEAPLSGMSLNPARTTASALWASAWDAAWVYFTAPILGMLLAAELYVRTRGLKNVICAKLNHRTERRCIFHCGYARRSASAVGAAGAAEAGVDGTRPGAEGGAHGEDTEHHVAGRHIGAPQTAQRP